MSTIMHKICLLYLLAATLLSCFKPTNSQSLSGIPATSLREGTEARIECHLEHAIDSTGFDWSGPAVTTDNISNGKVRIVNEGTASTLIITSVEGSDAGTYVCTHSLVSGDGLQITLTVTYEPAILDTQDLEYSVYEGENVVLSCQVRHCNEQCQDGAYWRKDITSINPDSIVTHDDITTVSITLNNAQQADAGSYECRVARDERQFTLTVTPHSERVPMLDKSPENQYEEFYYDEPLTLTCPVRSGENSTENPMIVSWVFKNIHDQQQYVPGPILTLVPGCFSRGEYKCTATNAFGTDSLRIFVEINAPPLPAVVNLPTLTFTDGSDQETLVLSHPESPVAISSLEYHWEKLAGEQWVPLSYSSGKYSKTHNGHLIISDITLMDAGSYRATVSNEFGSSVQTRQVEINPKPTPGAPVAIAFTFTLPDSISCTEVKESRDLLTEHLSSYLSSLCLNTTSRSTACADIAVQDVTVECPQASQQGAFRARLRSSSHATHTAQVFENSGPTRLSQHISIEPCTGGQCVLPTEAIESLRDMVIVLVVVVLVLVFVVIVTIIIVICVLKHKNCTKNCKVADVESNRRSVNQIQRSFSSPATISNDYSTSPTSFHDTLGQVNQSDHCYYSNC